MSDSEPFTLVTSSSYHEIFDDYKEVNSARAYDLDTSLQKALRRQYPDLSLTVTVDSNVDLLRFAAAGNAVAELDIKDESVKRLRYFFPGNPTVEYQINMSTTAHLPSMTSAGYILKKPAGGETTMSRNSVTDKLIAGIGQWHKLDVKYIYVYDDVGYWTMSRQLYKEIQKASWDDVILNEGMKKALTELVHKFFDSEDIYKELGVPWKRGVIFHGPAGNGKTVSIKALMNSLFKKKGVDIPSLYVKSAPRTFDIRSIFQRAREMAPCLLIFEDIDSIVTPGSKSYFFNEVDGLENNDGLFMVASTNHLDQLDPGLSNRPSRFDRKYLFPLPSEEERVLYCDFWREKLQSKPLIEFPKKLCVAIAGITQDFSFAYLKEAFVATLLTIAVHRSDVNPSSGDDDGGDLDSYELWREMKKQVKLLRDDMGSQEPAS